MIYTKTGDKGTTSLANGERVSKCDAHIEAYGTADELNSFFGWLRALLEQLPQDGMSVHAVQIATVQNKLFNLGAFLSFAPGEWLTETDVRDVEQWIDAIQAELPPQHAFILPAGSEAIAAAHICRTLRAPDHPHGRVRRQAVEPARLVRAPREAVPRLVRAGAARLQ